MTFKRALDKCVAEILRDGRRVLELPLDNQFTNFGLSDPLRNVQSEVAARIVALHFVAALQDGVSRVRFDGNKGAIDFVYSNGEERTAGMVTPGILILADMIREIVHSSKVGYTRAGAILLRYGIVRKELVIEYVKGEPMTLGISGFH